MNQDSISFSRLFQEYQPRVLRFAYSYVRDMQTAEDFVMDAMFEYWKNRETLRPDTNVPAYITVIIRNKCLNHLCHLKVKANASAQMSSLTQWSIDIRIRSLKDCNPEYLFSKEIRSIVESTLASLPVQTRRIFLMSRSKGLSYREIAKLESMTEKGVEYHIGNALKVLRVALKDYLGMMVFFI